MIDEGQRACDRDNETARFAFSPGYTYRRRAFRRFGDGFFHSCLAKYLNESAFGRRQEVAAILDHVSALPVEDDTAIQECVAMIDREIRLRARQLTHQLGYANAEAETILAGAVARYVDNHFFISDHRHMGWLPVASANRS